MIICYMYRKQEMVPEGCQNVNMAAKHNFVGLNTFLKFTGQDSQGPFFIFDIRIQQKHT